MVSEDAEALFSILHFEQSRDKTQGHGQDSPMQVVANNTKRLCNSCSTERRRRCDGGLLLQKSFEVLSCVATAAPLRPFIAATFIQIIRRRVRRLARYDASSDNAFWRRGAIRR